MNSQDMYLIKMLMRTNLKAREPIKGNGSILATNAANECEETGCEMVNKDKVRRSEKVRRPNKYLKKFVI